MKVHELIAKLEQLDPKLTVNSWTSTGDYGTPEPTLISKNGKIARVVICSKEDE